VIVNDGATVPLVSVIIPTRNRALLLKRALKSVLSQTYPYLEIVVVDDASTDETRDVVASFNNGAIRYIRHDNNMGGSAARNAGIRAASGHYISFLDDDDEWEPEKTEAQLKALRQYDAVLCTSNEHRRGIERYDARESIDLDDLRKGHFTAGGTSVLMARASVLKETMFDETLPRCQDWDIFIRIAKKYRIGYINKALVRYNEGEHGRISNAILNMPLAELEKRLVILEKHKKFFGPHWYRHHLAGFLLYGIKQRPDKLRHLDYSVKRCGFVPVVRALLRRAYQKLTGNV
jgi:GalNAc5-diNAcBac-PP-undecaprenol beta-1,3-glucosyltransferase